MNQLDILCFQISARSKNFSIAAQELMISQQAVSKHIKNLENQLGFPLFLRNYQNVVLTKAGERMLDFFSERQELLNSIHDAFVLPGDNDEIRIICSEWLGNPRNIRDFIHKFQKNHPDINIFINVLNHADTVSMFKNIHPDYILTSSYSSRHLPIPFYPVKRFEVPLYFMGNKNAVKDTDNYSVFPYFTAGSGESGIQEITSHLYELGKPIGYRPSSINVLDNMGSVFWNVLLQKGITVTPDIMKLNDNSPYFIKSCGLTATAVLCRTDISARQSIVLFEQELANESITD